MTDHWVCNQSNTTGATRGAGTVYPVGAPKLLVGFILLMLSYIHYVNVFKVCNTIHYIISGVIVGVIEWYLALQLPMQSVPITTKVVSSNLFHGEVYLIQHYVIMFVGYFSPGNSVFTPIEIDRYGITEILLKVALNTITLTLTAM